MLLEVLEIMASLGHKVYRKLYFIYFYFTTFMLVGLKQSITSNLFSKEEAVTF